MNITRQDLFTLVGDSWLNDEIINFYMNLLMERSEQGESMGLPKVYTMNTFFIPKLLSGGQASLKRWTRKVKIDCELQLNEFANLRLILFFLNYLFRSISLRMTWYQFQFM